MSLRGLVVEWASAFLARIETTARSNLLMREEIASPCGLATTL